MAIKKPIKQFFKIKMKQRQLSKEKLCTKFINAPGDDALELVETLVDMRDVECSCVFPAKKACQREVGTLFGLCLAHAKTKKGREITTTWNSLLEELGLENSREDTDEPDEESEEPEAPAVDSEKEDSDAESEDPDEEAESEEESDEPDELIATPPKRPFKPATGKNAAKPLAKPTKAVTKPAPKVTKAAPKKKDVSEESSSKAEGSARTKYVPPEDTEEESSESEKETERATISFSKSAHNNLVNKKTGLVLRHRDKTIIGIENKTGGIDSLTPEMVEYCQRNQLRYLAPN